MTRSLVAAVFAVPVVLAALPVRAQDATALPAPEPSQVVQPPPDPASPPAAPPYAPPVPYSPPPWYVQPAPHVEPLWYGPPAPPEREHTAPSGWYGWQTLIAVAPFDIAMFVGLSRFSDPAGTDTFAVAFTARNLVPAAVHLAHGRPGRAFGSVGLQAATTATGLAIGYAFGIALQGACQPQSPCRNGFRGIPPGPNYGAVAGSMLGTVLDVVFFAHSTRLAWTVAESEPSWTVAPFATQRSVGLSAGFAL